MTKLVFILPLLLTACGEPGPSNSDMAGCAVRRSGPPLSYREVADCAIERAERDKGTTR